MSTIPLAIKAAISYACLTFANNVVGSRHYKDISRPEKIGIASSIALGIDAVIVPAFTGGRTLHQMIIESTGFSIPEAVESGIEGAEFLLAYAGQLYHSARILHLSYKNRVKK